MQKPDAYEPKSELQTIIIFLSLKKDDYYFIIINFCVLPTQSQGTEQRAALG